jgi:mono/diheme cytochrome c family protein
MKKIAVIASIALVSFLSACGGEEKKDTSNASAEEPKSMVEDAPSYDPKRGTGKWNAENVILGESINQEWATSGENIASTKCTSCHKLTDEKLVGPGWAGVTKRRAPEWIMNFITNPDEMIDKDPEAQAMLELCLVRMPNQNLSDGEARNILEFMRKNDGVK